LQCAAFRRADVALGGPLGSAVRRVERDVLGDIALPAMKLEANDSDLSCSFCDRIGKSQLLDAARISRAIEFTRFPVSEPDDQDDEEGSLARREKLLRRPRLAKSLSLILRNIRKAKISVRPIAQWASFSHNRQTDRPFSRRDLSQTRNRHRRFWHSFPARQASAKPGPFQPKMSFAENRVLRVLRLGTAQRSAGNLLRPPFLWVPCHIGVNENKA
jgi:hypothetical protein